MRYIFDVKFFAQVAIDADSEEEARRILESVATPEKKEPGIRLDAGSQDGEADLIEKDFGPGIDF
tara:strand:- start:7445 stop:7639 length:195 start_codon:yes stop_codon:yes gene_type:complete